MSATESRPRREPPKFRRVQLREAVALSPRMTRVTVAGEDLEGLVVTDPGASVRILLPPPGTRELVMPTWNGNEFLLDDGSRPALRTLTPPIVDAGDETLELHVVMHDGGVLPGWVEGGQPGAEVAISGPGRGYTVDPSAPAYLLAGDETAIPAIVQLLGAMPQEMAVRVVIEVADHAGRLGLPSHPGAEVHWVDLPGGSAPGDALVTAVHSLQVHSGTQVWAAGEAASMQRIRRHLADDRHMPREQATVRGYWKYGRKGT